MSGLDRRDESEEKVMNEGINEAHSAKHPIVDQHRKKTS